jgi:rhodanese-related sulfurtransferase
MGTVRRALSFIAMGCGLVLFSSCRPAAQSVTNVQTGGSEESAESGENDEPAAADSLESVKAQVEGGEAVLVDVREPGEWTAGHIDVALSLPLSELREAPTAEQLKQRLPEDKVVYTHCAAGRRSVRAAEILKEQGYDVRPITHSYDELIEAGFTEVTE